MRAKMMSVVFAILGTVLLAPRLSQAQNLVALQAESGNWFTRCNGCQNTIWGTAGIDTVTTHITTPQKSQPWARFELVDAGGGKIALRADSGKWVSRCTDCIVGGTYPNFLIIQDAGATPPSNAQFTPVLLKNGKYGLQSDIGYYVALCHGCSPGAATPDQVAVHVVDPTSEPSAQWNIIPIIAGN